MRRWIAGAGSEETQLTAIFDIVAEQRREIQSTSGAQPEAAHRTIFSNRQLLSMICPLVIDKALALTVSLADSVMVSNAGEAAVSGVSMVDLINVLMIEVFSALAVGGAVVVSQRIGAKCFADAKRAAEQLLLITLALSLGVSALLFCFRVPLLTLLFHRVEPDVMTNCRIYLAITCLSYPFLAVCNAAVAVFRAQGNTRTGMFVGILINLINVAGNAILVYGFRLGAVGVAIPTLVSRAVGGLTSIVLLFRWNGGSFSVGPVRNIRYCRKTAMQLLHVGAPNAMESAMFQLGKLLVIVFLSGYGTTQIAADTMANRLAYFSYLIGLSINLAIVPVTGQCVGAQEFAQARINTRKVLLWCYLANVFSCALVMLGMGPVLRAYQASQVTSGYVRKLLWMHTAAVLTIWPLSFTIPSALRGAGDVRFTSGVAVMSMWVFRVGGSALLCLHFHWGVVGIWTAMFADWLFRAIFYVHRFHTETWYHMQV